MIFITEIAISILPVFVFLLALIVLDSYKLIRLKLLLFIITFGAIVALASYYINSYLYTQLEIDHFYFTRYVSPFVEELSKGIILIFLFKTNKIGFLVDAAIYGFAIGSGFAFIENIYYLQSVESASIAVWIIRGFGTAVMHGGATAIFSVSAKMLLDNSVKKNMYLFLPGFFAAVFIHSFFNHFLLPPVFITLMQLVVLPAVLTVIYTRSEKNLKEWLEIAFDVDVWQLEQITSGQFANTKTGKYLNTLKDKFPGLVVADMFCLLRLQLELTMRAKGDLLMKEAGFQVEADEDIIKDIEELEYLEKSIGKTGMMALSPILLSSRQELWELYLVK